VGDLKPERLVRAQELGCETIVLSKNTNLGEQVEKILGTPYVDSFVDCVGFEAYRPDQTAVVEQPAIVLNTAMAMVKAGGSIGIPGLYVTSDPGAKEQKAREGILGLEFGLGWSKALGLAMGQTPVMKYNRYLMNAILNERCHIAKVVGTKVVSLDEAPQAYQDFSDGASHKYLIDPHGLVK